MVDWSLVEVQDSTRMTLFPGVQESDSVVVHANQSHMVGIIFVPGHSQDGLVPRCFVENIRFAQVSNIELSGTSVGSYGGEYLSVGGKTHIVNLLVVSNHCSVDHLFLDVPNGTSSVDTASDDCSGVF